MTVGVVGGTYWERCLEPEWDRLYGSGYRAASILHACGIPSTLATRLSRGDEALLRTFAASQSIALELEIDDRPTIAFDYLCVLDEPRIWPPADGISRTRLHVTGDLVIAFGMLDGEPTFDADVAVWDPQSVFPLLPSALGTSRRLAVVANRSQIESLGKSPDLATAMTNLAIKERAEVIIAKNALAGATVLCGGEMLHVPAYASAGAFTLGSGDVFTTVFARAWALEGLGPQAAADTASRAVATYAATRAFDNLETETLADANLVPVTAKGGRVYLAAPFFDLGQLALLDMAEHALSQVGLTVVSPLREVGRGPAEAVAPADLALLATCDRIFAVLIDRDIGTVFEIGWGCEQGLPVVAYAPRMPAHQRTMLVGSGVRLFEDFAMAAVAAALA